MTGAAQALLPGELFATCPAPLAELLAHELTAIGAREVRPRGAGVSFRGDLALAYRACLWSRLASRVLVPMARTGAADADALYAGARALPWSAHLHPDATFAVDCTVRRARIPHSHYAALRVKDAIVDHFRERLGRRPDVDVRSPDIRVHVHLRGAEARIALDLAGDSLHRRGYRLETGPAPLRETLAAAVLALAGWPDAPAMPALVDPVCGSGTLLVEAALMAGDAAPGLLRPRFGFEAWLGHRPELWSGLLDEARARRDRGLARLPVLVGTDRDERALAAARANLERAGLDGLVTLEQRAVEDWRQGSAPRADGLLVANPPYGDRLQQADARRVREQLALLAAGPFARWAKSLLLPDDGGWPGDGSQPSLAVTNGALPCRIHVLAPASITTAPAPVDATPVANRIGRNRRRLRPWLRRENVTCYRVYDADLPEFNLAIDVYGTDDGDWAHVQEYAPPPEVDPLLAASRRDAALAVLPHALDIEPARIVLKTRERQRGPRQYQRRESAAALPGSELEVRENGVRLLVNLHDHLDSGLFLDHRPVRRWLREHSAGLRFLNLFAYTASATVHAAAGGARETLSVDLSAPYLQWARRNLDLNGFTAPAHRTERDDCLAWLAGDGARRAGRFDLVFLDPPTFSNSKRMRTSFDVQRDHVTLLRDAAALLAPGATLIFSCNRRGFRLDRAALDGFALEDWTAQSIPPDFSRPSPPHRCWFIRAR